MEGVDPAQLMHAVAVVQGEGLRVAVGRAFGALEGVGTAVVAHHKGVGISGEIEAIVVALRTLA